MEAKAVTDPGDQVRIEGVGMARLQRGVQAAKQGIVAVIHRDLLGSGEKSIRAVVGDGLIHGRRIQEREDERQEAAAPGRLHSPSTMGTSVCDWQPRPIGVPAGRQSRFAGGQFHGRRTVLGSAWSTSTPLPPPRNVCIISMNTLNPPEMSSYQATAVVLDELANRMAAGEQTIELALLMCSAEADFDDLGCHQLHGSGLLDR
ncbi:MAG: hypothetical protein ACR2H9_11255 [Longimicrobiaceae bacterium]